MEGRECTWRLVGLKLGLLEYESECSGYSRLYTVEEALARAV